MLTAIISFLSGNVFRLVFGEIVAAFNAHQEHKQELDRMRLQGELDAAQAQRNLDAIKIQADLGVKTIQVQAESAISQVEADGWAEAVKGTTRTTGVWLVDLWNGVIRPAVATWAIVMISGHYLKWWALDGNGWAICGAALGIYLADRSLFKRGK